MLDPGRTIYLVLLVLLGQGRKLASNCHDNRGSLSSRQERQEPGDKAFALPHRHDHHTLFITHPYEEELNTVSVHMLAWTVSCPSSALHTHHPSPSPTESCTAAQCWFYAAPAGLPCLPLMPEQNASQNPVPPAANCRSGGKDAILEVGLILWGTVTTKQCRCWWNGEDHRSTSSSCKVKGS